MEKELIKRIKESRKGYDKKSQRAELLVRNKQFLKELKKISTKFVVDFDDRNKFKTEKISSGGVNLYIDVERLSKFRKFCLKWHISSYWDGNIDTLSEYVKDSPEIISEPINFLLVNGGICSPDMEKISEELEGINYLYIKVDAWTSLEEVKKIWPRIEKFQKAIFNYKAELKSNFSRDLCWYDLKNRFKKSYREIADLWIKYFPDDIDFILIKKFKKENEEVLKERVETILILEDYPELLDAIKTGKLGDDIRSKFEDDKNLYITGQTGLGKLTPRFIDVIIRAVKRMQSYINQIHEPQSQRFFTVPLEDEQPTEKK